MELTREAALFAGGVRGVRLGNGVIEVGVAASVGPRILHFSVAGGPNMLAALPEMAETLAEGTWRIYGGHRLWHAPEAKPRTYAPDSEPVTLEELEDGVRVTAVADPMAHIAKAIEVRLAPGEATVTVRHQLRNDGLWPVELAPWALTVMAPGGTAVAPLPPRGSHDAQLQPTGGLALWAYTDLADPRWELGDRLALLHHDPARSTPQKLGFYPAGWLAYAVQGQLFVKYFSVDETAHYPDRGSVAELFANAHFVELESLGPLAPLAPGGTVTHRETWHLYPDVPRPEKESDALGTIWRLAEGGRSHHEQLRE